MLASVVLAGSPAWAAGPKLTTGKELAAALAAPAGVAWQGVPLRRALAGLTEAHGVAVLVDRRIDPSQPIDYEGKAPLRTVLAEAARAAGAEYSQVGDLAYIGPAETARTLRTLLALVAAEVARLPERERRAWSQRAALGWSELSEPRSLLTQWTGAQHVTLEGLEQAPHDLWSAFAGPAMTLAERVSLVAAQFDLAIDFGAGKEGVARLVPRPTPVAIERSYPAGGNPQERLAEWQRLAPEAAIRLDGKRIIVRGLIEEHERLVPAGSKAAPVAGRGKVEERHRVAVKNVPLEKLLDELHKRLDLEFSYDRQALETAGVRLDTPVSVDVDDATTDELLEKVLQPAGLKFKRRGKKVEISK